MRLEIVDFNMMLMVADLLVFQSSHDLPEDSINAFPQVSHSSLMTTVVVDDFDNRSICDVYFLLETVVFLESILFLKFRNEVILGDFNLFNG